MASNVPAPTSLDDLTYREQFAAYQIRNNIGEIQNLIKALPDADPNSLTSIRDTLWDGSDTAPEFNVCIVGAGAAGLFTGMLFDYLSANFGLKVKYEIVEANGPERVGGRLYTHKFPGTEDNAHQYYDVGAMRFPDFKVMKRTFELFNTLDMQKVSSPDTPDKEAIRTAPLGSLIPYYLSSKLKTTPCLYNDIRITSKEVPSANAFGITDIPDKYRNNDPDKMVNDLIQPYLDTYNKESPKAFWKMLMEKGDKHTVRSYLTEYGKFDYKTIEFLETLNFGNRWYDQAFSELVSDTLDFSAKCEWRCVMGGAQQIAYRMQDQIDKTQSGRITYGKVVSSVGYLDQPGPNQERLEVGFHGEEGTRQYHAVFNSAPLGAQQHMNLDRLNLNWGTKLAIRNLGYGASCKIGIRFSRMWWMTDLDDSNCIDGGAAKTDQSIRVCVYPSYNLYDDKTKPGVLLASYTWSAEAQKIGALIDRRSPDNEDELKELLFHDLAKLHAKSGDLEDYKRLYKVIKESYMDHYAYDWYSDKRQVGAFAYFGCGQFSNMWQWITRTDGRYVIIGEAASAHHAWVVGSLESVVRGVYQFLYRHSKNSKGAHDALQAFNNGKIEGPYGPLPHEYDRTEDIQYMNSQKDPQSPVGEMARHQVMTEAIRQKQGQDQLDPSSVVRDQLKTWFPTEFLKPVAAAA